MAKESSTSALEALVNRSPIEASEGAIKDLRDIAGDEALGTSKYLKDKSESHSNNRSAEQAEDSMDIQLTYEKLRQLKNHVLPKIINPDSRYNYKWFSLDSQGRSNYYYSITNLGYSPVTLSDMPEMGGYINYAENIDRSVVVDRIVVKEMILCKISKKNRQILMTENHHNRPAALAGDIYREFHEKVSGGRSQGFIQYNKNAFSRDQDETGSFGVSQTEEISASYQVGMDGIVTHTRKPVFE